MPYINFKTNVKVENRNELQQKLGELICKIPGKSPEVTMILIDSEQPLFYAGTDEPCAMVETQVNFGTDQSHVQDYCYAVIDMVSEKLGIPLHRIYVNVNAMDNWFVKR